MAVNINQMRENDFKHGIGPGGRWLIFAGVPHVSVAATACAQDWLVRVVGEKAFPYVGVGIVGATFVICMVFYHRIPKRFVIPLGMVGWVISFSLLSWYFVFGGPGTLKM